MNCDFSLLSSIGLKAGLVIMGLVNLVCKPKITVVESARVDTLIVQVPENRSVEHDTLDYVMGRFDPKIRTDFVQIPLIYASRAGMYLRQESMADFIKMATAAASEGVRLKILSATRNFSDQKNIWEDKWTGRRLVENGQNLALTTPDPNRRALKILEYSSMPGSSRHHWGSDMDLNALDDAYFTLGEGKKIYDWLVDHAHEYGFCQPYTAGRPYGYKEEKWHWSYLPVSKPLTDYCQHHLKNESINGFDGAETAASIDIVHHYVLGINEKCK